MKLFATTLAVAYAITAEALVARTTDCCFGLTASGAVSGTVGQLSDGQNRVGGNFPTGKYCINGQGGITDGKGRGCFLTPPTQQFQCDVGQSPVSGFAVGCHGELSYNGNHKFFACPTGDKGSSNIYTTTNDKLGCVETTLTADSCFSGCPPPSPPPAPPAPPAPKSCPANLNGAYEFPHLIVPVNSASPDQASGTSLFGEVSSSISSIFNFDIPSSDSGKTCSLVFLFPEQSQLTTSSFTITGSGDIDFSELSKPATDSTTFNNAPSVSTDFGVKHVAPGNSYSIATFDCPAGDKVGFKLSTSGDTHLRYFQDFNPSPIGLYITVC